MGNTTSDVNDSLKAQADSENGPEIYKLVNVSGGGELTRLMKLAMQTKDFTEVDDLIKTEVIKYLYNDGKGEKLPIGDFVAKRCGGKLSAKTKIQELTTGQLEETNPENFKSHCFRLDAVGAVGESLLHLCMLNGTDLFIELAKRLIMHFPAMINDIYLSEDYFGETALHMAIVSEDPIMVKFLLCHGADVHERCCGKFFLPEDQKSGMQNSSKRLYPNFPIKTNYVSYSYFGEYPLSFAAILNQEECIRLLIAKGADPNRQDGNGNTVLHMLVIYNNLKMFQMMLEFNSSLHIKNKQGLTPLNLAARLARAEMFYYILNRLRQVWFTYGDISTGSYPLDTIDTIASDGSVDTTCSIYLVINGETEEHLDLIDGLVIDLLNKKWNSYIKYNFYFEFFVYMFFLLVQAGDVIMKVLYNTYLKEHHCMEHENSHNAFISQCSCCYLYPSDYSRYGRTIFDIIIWAYSIIQLIIIVSEFVVQGIQLYVKTLLFNPSKVLFILSLLCWLLIIPMRLSCNTYAEDVLTVLAIITQSTYILYLGRGFKTITTFVYIIHLVFKTNFAKFMIIYSIFMAGFSQAFYMATGFGLPHYFGSPLESLYDCVVMTVRDLYTIYPAVKKAEYSVLAKILLVCFMIMVSIVLVNLLIAMMANTYVKVTQLKREWLRQWAKQVLTIEQNLTRKERLKQQKKYATELSSGQRVFMVFWKQNAQERGNVKGERERFREIINRIE